MKLLVPLLYLLLLVTAVPWFWPPDSMILIAGLPAWVCVAIAVSALVSLLTLAVLLKPWPQEDASANE